MKMRKAKKFRITIPIVVLIVMLTYTISASALMVSTLQKVNTQAIMKAQVEATKGSRLDSHDGEMMPNANPIMAYKNEDCTGQENHYIIAGDWYDIVKINTGSNSIELRYPITVANGKYDEIEIHWFHYDEWKANSDGSVGEITSKIDSNKWYNDTNVNSALGSVHYTDERTNGGGKTFSSINQPITVTPADPNGHRKLMCGSTVVMMASDKPTSYCFYDHADLRDADWGWVRAGN